MPDTYYRLILSYLRGRTFAVKYQQAVSSSKPIQAGVPQGSVLGPFLYLIYVHDLPHLDGNKTAQFADDLAVLQVADTFPEASDALLGSLEEINKWCKDWRISMNPQKSVIIPFTLRRQIYSDRLSLGETVIPVDSSVRYLGLHLDAKLTWKSHIAYLVGRIRERIRQLRPLMSPDSPLTLDTKRLVYLSLIRPIWSYSCGLWGCAAASHIKKIQVTQNRVLRMITGAPWYVRNSRLHTDLDIPQVTTVIKETYESLNRRMIEHENPMVASIPESATPPPTARRLKRKRPQDSILQTANQNHPT